MADVVIDGGERSCGELLLVIYRTIRDLAPGTPVAVIAHDPVAPLDLPVWCHLAGHEYGGQIAADPPTYLVTVAAGRPMNPDRPWHPLSTKENA